MPWTAMRLAANLDKTKRQFDCKQTSQLSRFGRETHGFKAILTVSRSHGQLLISHCHSQELTVLGA